MIRKAQLLQTLVTLCFGLSICSSLIAQTGKRLDRNNPLLYVDASGRTAIAKSIDQWQSRRAMVLDGMQSIMGPFPADEKRCNLDVKIQEEEDCGTYVRRLITYSSEPGCRVPAYLLIPKIALRGDVKLPGALCLHPTDNVDGHKLVVGLGKRPNRQYAQELAERGYVAIAPSYPLLANYQPDWEQLGYQSGTMKAVWDNVRALDLLQSLYFVDPDSIGAIGHSLGGHNAVYTAVFDQRVKVVVTSCGLDSYLDYKQGDIRGWTSTRYMPRLLNYKDRLTEIPFDFHEMIAALAPRWCQIIAPTRDSNFQADSVDRIQAAAAKVYKLYGKESRLEVVHPECAHDFPPDMRERAYELFDRVLKQK